MQGQAFSQVQPTRNCLTQPDKGEFSGGGVERISPRRRVPDNGMPGATCRSVLEGRRNDGSRSPHLVCLTDQGPSREGLANRKIEAHGGKSQRCSSTGKRSIQQETNGQGTGDSWPPLPDRLWTLKSLDHDPPKVNYFASFPFFKIGFQGKCLCNVRRRSRGFCSPILLAVLSRIQATPPSLHCVTWLLLTAAPGLGLWGGQWRVYVLN